MGPRCTRTKAVVSYKSPVPLYAVLTTLTTTAMMNQGEERGGTAGSAEGQGIVIGSDFLWSSSNRFTSFSVSLVQECNETRTAARSKKRFPSSSDPQSGVAACVSFWVDDNFLPIYEVTTPVHIGWKSRHYAAPLKVSINQTNHVIIDSKSRSFRVNDVHFLFTVSAANATQMLESKCAFLLVYGGDLNHNK